MHYCNAALLSLTLNQASAVKQLNSTNIMNTTEITARAKAYSSEGIKTHKFSVDADGTVRVWDSVAGHYTTCHSLSKSAEARIRRLAK